MPEVKARKNSNKVFVTRLAVGASAAVAALTAADRLLPLNIRGNAYLDIILTSLGALAYTLFLAFLPFLAFFVLRALVRRSRGESSADLVYWLPLLVELLAVAAFFLIPTTTGYAANRRAYHEVVSLVEQGGLPRSGGGSISLPATYRGLTTTGTVLTDEKNGALRIFFPLERRTGSYQRFLVHVADDRNPVGIEQQAENKKQPRIAAQKLEKHWYDLVIY